MKGDEREGDWWAAGPPPPPAALQTKPRMMQSWSGAAEAARLRGKVGTPGGQGSGWQGRHLGLWMPDPKFPAQYWPPPDPSPRIKALLKWSQLESDMMQLGHHSRRPPQRGKHLPTGRGDDERPRHQVESEAPVESLSSTSVDAGLCLPFLSSWR